MAGKESSTLWWPQPGSHLTGSLRVFSDLFGYFETLNVIHEFVAVIKPSNLSPALLNRDRSKTTNKRCCFASTFNTRNMLLKGCSCQDAIKSAGGEQ